MAGVVFELLISYYSVTYPKTIKFNVVYYSVWATIPSSGRRRKEYILKLFKNSCKK